MSETDLSKEVLKFFEEQATSIPWLDDFDIYITDDSSKPIIIMSNDEYKKQIYRMTGQ